MDGAGMSACGAQLTLETAVPVWARLEAIRLEKQRVLARLAAARDAVDRGFDAEAGELAGSGREVESGGDAPSASTPTPTPTPGPPVAAVEEARKAVARKQRAVAAGGGCLLRCCTVCLCARLGVAVCVGVGGGLPSSMLNCVCDWECVCVGGGGAEGLVAVD